jgi:hypothetical protein
MIILEVNINGRMTLNPLPKSIFIIVGALWITTTNGQQVNSLGVFTGITIPYTFDEGINKDARYRIKYNVKFAPIGIHYGVDYDGFGFMVDPSVTKIGQNFNVINISGGDVGERNIDMTYFQLPIGLKLHIIDLSFFKVSFVTSIGLGVLIDGKETITHRDSKLKFPTAITGIYPSPENAEFEEENPGYTVEYDGVLVPSLTDNPLLAKKDFQSIQLFGALGFRSDWDITETWRVSFDIRGNIGAFEPRGDEHLDKIKNNDAIYEIEGARRDLFLSVNIGLARTIEIEPQEKERKIRKRREGKPHKPTKYPWQKPRNKKPKD